MQPAYYIPMGPDRLQLIGEICAIQGQIEWMMQNTVRDLLKIDQLTTQRIMGSTSIGTNAEIWINIVRRKQRRKAVLAQAEQAFSEIKDLAEGRNDFVHAVYFSKALNPTGLMVRVINGFTNPPEHDRAVAVRVRSRKEVPVEKLTEVRDTAAAISVRVAHTHWMTAILPAEKEPSPWRDRLAELPPPPAPKKAPRRAKEQRTQPRSLKG